MKARAIDVSQSTNNSEIKPVEVQALLDADPQFIELIRQLTDARVGHLNDVVAQKNIDALKLKHQDVVTKTLTIDVADKKVLSPTVFKIEGIRDSIKSSTSKSLNTEYAEKLYVEDTNAIISHFGDDNSDFPVFLESVERVNSSDPFNKKETLTLKLNTTNKGRSQTFKVDIPKFSKDGEIFINGTKKQMLNQLAQLPIVKTRLNGEDAVQYNTFYNKCIMTRTPGNLSPDISKLKKYLSLGNKSKTVKASLGNTTVISKGKDISLEYGELATVCSKLKVGEYAFNFNLEAMISDINAIDLNLMGTIKEMNVFPIGMKGSSIIVSKWDGEILLFDRKTKNTTSISPSIFELVKKQLEDEGGGAVNDLESINAGSKQTYTVARIHDQKVPLIIILGFKDGIESVLDRANIHYDATPVDRQGRPAGMNRTIKFKDFQIHYNGSNVQHDILMAGLNPLTDHDVKWSDLGKDGEAYNKYFADQGTSLFGRSLRNFYQFFLDPVTRDILTDIGLPNDLVGSLLYCNSLLADPRVSKKNDIRLYRLRSQEVVNQLLYKRLSIAIAEFKDKRTDGISIKQDAIIRDFLDSGLVEEQAVLNPALEAEGMTKATWRGTGGAKFGHAQGTEEFRAYDKGMVGIFGAGTPNDINVGTIRKLAYNTNVTSPRGYLKAGTDSKNLDPTQMLGVSELLQNFTARHSDPFRQSMAIRHSEHTMPTVIQHKPMVGSGMDFALPYYTSDEFSFKAKEDGIIETYNEAKQFVIVKYTSGTTEVIDLSPRQRKTNVGGFFITTKLSGKLKKGQKFKKNDILAQDDSFFRDDHKGRAQYMSGVMCRIAVAPLDATFEDSSVITETASHKLASWVTFEKDASLSAKATVEKIAKKGQIIKAGEPLLVFEESFDDDNAGSINKMLEKLNDKDTSNLEDFGKTTIDSKYGGEIVDVHVIYNVELKEMSSSLRKIVEASIKDEDEKAKAMHGAGADQILMPPHIEKIDRTKIRGTEFSGVLFTFYVKVYSPALSGEKIAFERAAKSIISTVLPDKDSPYTGNGQIIDCILSPLSLMARMTPDVLLSMYTNKVLIGLKEKIKEIVKK
jgi:DNA-directed RNA polymerase beta subunit